jgi:hypothetical protein
MESMTVQGLLTELETARDSLDRALECLFQPRITQPLHNNSRTFESAQPSPTIKFVTENGFTIERACERERHLSDSASGCHFFVSRPPDKEGCVTVGFAEEMIQLVVAQDSQSPLNKAFWLRCAERHLARYLWEKNRVPPGGVLNVAQLCAEALFMARPSD